MCNKRNEKKYTETCEKNIAKEDIPVFGNYNFYVFEYIH